jgi:hypothetical protein
MTQLWARKVGKYSRLLVTSGMIPFGNLQVVTTAEYNTVTDFHATNHSTLTSLSIYTSLRYPFPGNGFITFTVNKSSNHTLSLHRTSSNSSSTATELLCAVVFPLS